LIIRAKKALKYIQEQEDKGNILVVTHGDFGKMLYAAYYDLEWRDVVTGFHFGNSEALLLSPDIKAEDRHLFQMKQYNH